MTTSAPTRAYQAETLSIAAGGITFGALAWGDPSAPLALLVHGYPDTAWTWRHLGPFLADRGWRAVAPFTRGYGPTDLAPNGRYLLADLVDDVLALHTALGGDDHAVLVGHDWGSLTVWGVTAREPERFARYVAMSVPPTPALLRPFASIRTLGIGLHQARMSWYFLYNQIPGTERLFDRLIPYLWRSWSPGYDPSNDLDHLFQSLRDVEQRRASQRYYRHNLQRDLKTGFSLRPGAPALYLHGEQDGCMQPELIELAGDLLKQGSRVERIPGVGHFMQLENPAVVNALIAEWLGEPSSAPA
jgi:pimeloyl-ACP methyl ester carboxylesterase